MTEGQETGSPPAGPAAGEDERAGRSPAFGHEEAEAVADAQDEAVEEGALPPSQDDAGPGGR
jgi:hypothetical protein